jgi:hypothetical protein
MLRARVDALRSLPPDSPGGARENVDEIEIDALAMAVANELRERLTCEVQGESAPTRDEAHAEVRRVEAPPAGESATQAR